ncbi:MAG: phytoene desaturase [Anaerolineae bacterium]|nr:phytoene desaturase [Anaerolineae bacterium]
MTSVLVVGAGVGGIAVAARLARRGYDVTVLEKNAVPGGRCNQIVQDGHRFDVGPSLFLLPQVYAATYAALGERMEDHLDLKRIDPTYHIHFEDDTVLQLSADINWMQTQLEAIEPGSFGGFLRYMAEGYHHLDIALGRFLTKNFYTLFDQVNPGNLSLLTELKLLQKHYDNLGNYFKGDKLKAVFSFQDVYMGLSPYESPATYSMLQYTELADGVWFPVGGMYRIVESLTSIAEGHGARFVYESPVTQIVAEGSRATGVVLEDDSTMRADIVIANADLPYVYDRLLPDRDLGKRMMNKQFTCSAIMFYWAVDTVYPQLAHHTLFLSGDYKASSDCIFHDHTLPEKPSFYIHVPNRTDPTAAPEGCDNLMVLVPVGCLYEELDQDFEALRARAKETVLKRLERLGITDLEAHIKHEVSYTPHDWREMFNLARGATFGLKHNLMQLGYMRPHNRHGRYKNLYFCGASTHPGTGVPIAFLGAGLVEERILKEQPTI